MPILGILGILHYLNGKYGLGFFVPDAIAAGARLIAADAPLRHSVQLSIPFPFNALGPVPDWTWTCMNVSGRKMPA